MGVERIRRGKGGGESELGWVKGKGRFDKERGA